MYSCAWVVLLSVNDTVCTTVACRTVWLAVTDSNQCLCTLSTLAPVPAGYGMVGRGAQKCEAGTYNPGNNYDACTKCAFGYTTLGAGVGVTAADCVTDLGYGIKNGIMGQCPIGECRWLHYCTSCCDCMWL